MSHRAREVATPGVCCAVALALAAGAAVVGCATAAATAGAPAAGAPAAGAPAATSRPAVTRPAAPVAGPPAPDPACVAARNAEQTLQSRQGQDQNNQAALNQDFLNFAAALSAAAQSEKRPPAAQAMTALASDYTALVQSQSGAAQLPDMSQVQKDGAAFDQACPS